MEVYHYDAVDGAYAGVSEAAVLPLREHLPDNEITKYLVPANAIVDPPPPEAPDGHAARWNGTSWEIAEDHRGEVGFVDGVPATIATVGPYPPGWSTEPSTPTEEEVAAKMAELQLRKAVAIDADSAIDLASVRECLRRIESILS